MFNVFFKVFLISVIFPTSIFITSTKELGSGIILFRLYPKEENLAQFLLFRPNASLFQNQWINVNVRVKRDAVPLEVIQDELFKRSTIRDCDIHIVSKFTQEIQIVVNRMQHKRSVIYYLGKVLKPEIKVKLISEYYLEFKWFTIEEIRPLIMYSEQKEVMEAAYKFLQTNNFNVTYL